MSSYLLGSSEAEHHRLARQHELWGPDLLRTLQTYRVGAGSRILEVGCGPGLLLRDLVDLAGPGGQAEGLELDATSVERARERGLRVRQGDLRTADLDGPWDVIVARWVLSFLGDAHEPVTKLAEALRPGGLLIVQDYVHDGLSLHPPNPVFDRIIAGMRAAYAARGGDLWVGLELNGAFSAATLEVLSCAPQVRGGSARSEVARWFRDFVVLHADRFVEHGGLDPADAQAFQRAWEDFADQPDAYFVSPMQITAVGRKSRALPGPRAG